MMKTGPHLFSTTWRLLSTAPGNAGQHRPPDALAAAGVQGVTIYPNWDHFPTLLGQVERGSEAESEDLRIATMAFTSGRAPEDKLRDLATNGRRAAGQECRTYRIEGGKLAKTCAAYDC
jgi:hypothetical protein